MGDKELWLLWALKGYIDNGYVSYCSWSGKTISRSEFYRMRREILHKNSSEYREHHGDQ